MEPVEKCPNGLAKLIESPAESDANEQAHNLGITGNI